MNLDLSLCFPVGEDGKRGPLPKQQLFIDKVLDEAGPKYVGYVGGIGSGKSLIGCYVMLVQGIIHGGEYVIGRQFMPELRRTTYKQFLEMIPKELLIEHRVADAEIHIKSMKGKAVFYMCQLEEPDKLRSLNLSGYLVDEGSQVSEEAFLLLNGRLRNPKGLRKGLVVGNSEGHNWIYQYFVKQDMFSDAFTKRLYFMIVAPSTENRHLPQGYVETLLKTYSKERAQREIYASWDAFEGMVYHEFDRQVHIIRPFRIPTDWTRIAGVDHGYRNPAAWIWIAIDYDDNMYVYREFYQREWLIEEIVKGKDGEPGVVSLNKGDKLEIIAIDPSTRNVRGQSGTSDYDTYLEHMPKSWGLSLANNDVGPGIDAVKSRLKIDEKTGKPRLFIFDTCPHLIEELTQYRYEANMSANKNEKESPVKKNDHACDALRYAVMTRPDAPVSPRANDKVPYNSIQYSLQKELKNIKKPKARDPWRDY